MVDQVFMSQKLTDKNNINDMAVIPERPSTSIALVN